MPTDMTDMPADAALVGRPSKRPKRPRFARDDQTSPSTVPPSARASLTTLPIEILAEVLLYTCSPPTVLAVSRTCSFLYRFLAQNPAASFIWRGVRKTCRPAPVPDPGPNWKKTEADYAAFVFGGGVCEVCRKATRAIYVSFAARIRLCGSWHCRRKLLAESLVNVTSIFKGRGRESLWEPYVESNLCFYPSTYHVSIWPNNCSILLRKTDLEKFQLEHAVYQNAEQERTRDESRLAGASDSFSVAIREESERREHIMERCHTKIQEFPAIMELSARLVHWKHKYDREHKNIKKQNRVWTKNLAEREGWDLADLVASQTYGSLQKRKTFLLEKIESNDVSPVWSAIESELLAVKARHDRQKAEATYRQKLSEVKQIYDRMRYGSLDGNHMAGPSDPTGIPILPSLSVFCMLPSVRALRGSPDPSAVPPSDTSATIDIKSSPLVTSLITSDLRTWLVPVQKHLMSLLGYPNGWQSASTRTLHPLKRVTARFFCRRCGEGEGSREYRRELCLDLKGVCSHVCVQGKGIKQRGREAYQDGKTEVTDTGDGSGRENTESRGKKKSGVKTLDWKIDLFVRDEKAIRLVRSILELACLSEDDPSTASALNAKGGVIRCMSCRGGIVMDFDTAIGHAHRHESMEIQLLSTSTPCQVALSEDASTPNGYTGCAIHDWLPTFERGTSELLLGPSHRARRLCKKVNYGCRHCFLVSPENEVTTTPNARKGARALDFNGLRSHVKAKHGIQDMHDEDFFCYSSIQDSGKNRQG